MHHHYAARTECGVTINFIKGVDEGTELLSPFIFKTLHTNFTGKMCQQPRVNLEGTGLL